MSLGHSRKIDLWGLTREKSIGFNSREGISHNIVRSTNISNGGSKLSNDESDEVNVYQYESSVEKGDITPSAINKLLENSTTALSEASVIRLVVASGVRYDRREALDNKG